MDDAAAVIHKTVDGQDRELYVCKACAAKEAQGRPPRDRKRPPSGPADFSVTIAAGPGSDDPPPPLVDALVHATMDFMNKIASNTKAPDLVCPVCGTHWKDVEESGHVGCPACYKAFAGRLVGHLHTTQRGIRHVGKIPPGASGEGARKFLERQLAEAVSKQNFEEASRLRDQLRILNERTQRPEGPQA